MKITSNNGQYMTTCCEDELRVINAALYFMLRCAWEHISFTKVEEHVSSVAGKLRNDLCSVIEEIKDQPEFEAKKQKCLDCEAVFHEGHCKCEK